MPAIVYAGNGWFFERIADGRLRIRKLPTEILSGSDVPVRVELDQQIAPDQWTEILAALTTRTLEEARQFWMREVPRT
jgi:hypothetical protein